MKKIILAIALAVLCVGPVCAQDKLPVRFEVGAGFAPLFLMGVEDSFEVPYKLDAFFEARYDLGRFFDLGLKADYKFNPFKGESHAYDHFSYKGHQHYGALIATAGLKIPVNEQFLFFAGMGFGPGMVRKSITDANISAPEDAESPVGSHNSGLFLVVAPRIGAQLYDHLRLSISADLTTDEAEDRAETRWPVCLNIGWTF